MFFAGDLLPLQIQTDQRASTLLHSAADRDRERLANGL